ncbi:uncharacterized protein OCT59_003152 [Rhizophagus irregularis]|uniref:uncharacterized protein n=1 Tax=Rhizophagus irregularis TaxID=588596 RepID=UPI003327E19F|nr:hypothetical protein OCT59_003152 [Rhizophagus irregularis]
MIGREATISTYTDGANLCKLKIFRIDILDNIDHVSSFKQPLDLEKDGTNPRTPEDKKRTVTFEEEESSTSAMSYIPAIPVESPTSIDPSNSKSAVHNQPQYEEDHTKIEDHENKNDGGNDDVDKETCAKVAFRQSFEKIPETTKLKLSSGRVVEDLLFNYVKDNDYEDHAHSFIINCDNQGIRELFNDEEWKAFLMFHLILQKK